MSLSRIKYIKDKFKTWVNNKTHPFCKNEKGLIDVNSSNDIDVPIKNNGNEIIPSQQNIINRIKSTKNKTNGIFESPVKKTETFLKSQKRFIGHFFDTTKTHFTYFSDLGRKYSGFINKKFIFKLKIGIFSICSFALIFKYSNVISPYFKYRMERWIENDKKLRSERDSAQNK